MIRIEEQSHEEKVKMYKKSTKAELIEMLIACNNALDRHSVNRTQSTILSSFDFLKDEPDLYGS